MQLPNQSPGLRSGLAGSSTTHGRVEASALRLRAPGAIGDDVCDAACICCGLPSPIQPECCGACIACNLKDLWPWVAPPQLGVVI